jgi:hypothetical protein
LPIISNDPIIHLGFLKSINRFQNIARRLHIFPNGIIQAAFEEEAAFQVAQKDDAKTRRNGEYNRA